MIVAIVMFYSIAQRNRYAKRNIVYYNDQLHQVEQALENGMPELSAEEKFGCSIVMAKEINDVELADLYATGALVMDLTVNGEYVGKVAWNDKMENFNTTKSNILKAAFLLCITILVLGYLLLYYMYKVFLKPIEELKNFATDIAKGDLDKPLPIHKDNMFGSFVEGFDMMREQIKISINRERKAEIARKELIQGLSHDIKTPLSVIGATCEVLELKYKRKMNEPGAPVEECSDTLEKVRTISSKADVVSALMSDVMHANLDENEKISINVKEESTLILEERIKTLSAFGNIILENRIHPCLVYMDKKRMEQVIDNIIGNSAKYAGTDIVVSFSETESILMTDGKRGSFIKIRIRDNGPGVDKDDLPLIAEKYYRGKNAANYSGYGLGLYLCKMYMNKQGGGMEYYNDNGFVVELLLRKV